MQKLSRWARRRRASSSQSSAEGRGGAPASPPPLLLLLLLVPPPASQQGPPGRAQRRVTAAESALSDWTEPPSPDPRPVELLEGTISAVPEAGTSWMVQIKLLGLDSGGPAGERYDLFSETIQKM